MKRLISALLGLVLVFSILPMSVFASDGESEKEVYFDGAYITVSIDYSSARTSGSVTGNKTYTYHSSDGTALWKAVLTGTFSYNGNTSNCTAANCSVTVYESEWYTISKSASNSGNSATASVTMGKKLLGVTVSNIPINIKLSCDKIGNLS